MLQRRTPLRRSVPLRQRTPLLAHSLPLSSPQSRSEKRKRPRPPELVNEEYIAWLRRQRCRVTGKPGPNDAHHLRHDSNGASLGRNRKDDNRAITLDHEVHIHQRGPLKDFFAGWTRAMVRSWEDEQLATQRAEFLAWKAQRDEISFHEPDNGLG